MSVRGRWVVLLLLVTTGFVLRLYNLNGVPLRGDEAFTVQNWMRLPLSDSLSRIATIEPHPSLVYMLFRGWGLAAGTTEFAARYLPALVNLLGIPALYALGKRLFGWRAGLLAAFLYAVHPYLVWHSQDARNYALWVGLSVVSWWLGLRAFENGRRTDLGLYFVAALLAANLFYLEWFMLLALAVYALLNSSSNRRGLFRLLGVQAVVALSSVVSFAVLQLPILLNGTYGGTTGGGLEPLRLVTWFLPTLFLGETLPAPVWLGYVVLALLLVSAVVLIRFRPRAALYLWLPALLLPVLLSIASLRLDVFTPRYILPASPVYLLMFASALSILLSRHAVPRLLAGALLLTWLATAAYTLTNYFSINDYRKSQDWPGLSAYLESRVTPEDLVIQLSADAAFGFYYHAPAVDVALPASPSQPAAEIVATLQAAAQTHDALWLVGQTFPDWPNVGVVENWARSELQAVRQTTFAGLRIEQYKPWAVNSDEVADQPLAVFSDIVQLIGAQVFLPPEPTGEITVWVYWQPLQRTSAPLKVFLHLQGTMNPATGSPLWSQDDQYPQDGRISTTEWSDRTIYRDIYILPVQALPNGEYELRIGFYDPDTNERLVREDGSESYRLATLQLP